MSWIWRVINLLATLIFIPIAISFHALRLALMVLSWAIGLSIAALVGYVAFIALRALLFGVPMGDDPATPLGWAVLGLFVLCCWSVVLLFWADMREMDKEKVFAGRGSHGSARFGSKRDRAAFHTENGLLIGRDHVTGQLLRYTGPAHLLTLAPTRAGKGVGTIIPNLLTANRSVLVIDPKGENAGITVGIRRRFGSVHVLDPFGITGLPSAACNPMDRLDPESPDIGDEAASLAEALVMDPPGQVHDAHWNEEAKSLIAGRILFCACHEPKARRNLATLREYLSLRGEKWAMLLELMQDSAAAGGLIARAGNRFSGKSEREAASVLSNAQRHTRFLDSPRIAAAMSRSDLDFGELRKTITSVFLVLPPNRLDAYSRWLRLVVAQALSDIAMAAERPTAPLSAAETATGAPDDPETPRNGPQSPQRPLKSPVLFLLDEFAALGRLEAVERAMGLMAGYGVQLWPILQDLSQLRALYGTRAGTFLANAAVQQVFGVNDLETAKWLSESIGKETTYTSSASTRPGEWASTTTTTSTARDLMGPDEIMQLPGDLQLLRVQGQPVMLTRKLRYYADPEFRKLVSQQPA